MRVRRPGWGRRSWRWPLPLVGVAIRLRAMQLGLAAASCECVRRSCGRCSWSWPLPLAGAAAGLRVSQLELAAASRFRVRRPDCGRRSWSWPLLLAGAAARLRATQLELAAASCACGGRPAGVAAGAGRCLLRVRQPGCRRRSWSWPLHIPRAAAGLRATQLELAAASCACGGRAAGDAAGVGRCLLRGLKCSYASSSQAELEVSSCCRLSVLLLGGGLLLAPARLRRAAAVTQPPCGSRLWPGGFEVLLRGPWRRRSWRCPAAAGLACCCWEAG
jgi:hypothetical protein